jgi:formylglycine-generating enzyme required for sulfatase activity
LSDSPYGTFDQGGNVYEWNELIQFFGEGRAIRGGAWQYPVGSLAAPQLNGFAPFAESSFIGFRVASLVPEPGTGLLMMMGLLGLAHRQRRRGRAPN